MHIHEFLCVFFVVVGVLFLVVVFWLFFVGFLGGGLHTGERIHLNETNAKLK